MNKSMFAIAALTFAQLISKAFTGSPVDELPKPYVPPKSDDAAHIARAEEKRRRRKAAKLMKDHNHG